jgi:hypothetical protein
VLVFGGEDFLIGAHVHAAVDHRQTFGGAAGQGDLAGVGLQIATGPDPHFVFALFDHAEVPIHGQAGVVVEGGAVRSIASRTGFGCEVIRKLEKCRYAGS